MTKRLTLNAEKRKSIESVFQSHWIENSKFNKGLQEAKEKYNQMRVKMLSLVSNVVRHHQPQQDVDTIRAMSNKYANKKNNTQRRKAKSDCRSISIFLRR